MLEKNNLHFWAFFQCHVKLFHSRQQISHSDSNNKSTGKEKICVCSLGNCTQSKCLSFVCRICERGFFDSKELKKHTEATHFDLESSKCPSCEYPCASKHELEVHIIRAHKVAKSVCNKCGEKFKFKIELKRHLVICSNSSNDKKQYRCQQCDKRFGKKALLKIHVRDIHKDTAPRDFECHKCAKSYSSFFHLNRHLQNHSHECQECGKTFKTREERKEHIKERHKKETYKYHLNSHECNVCHKYFDREKDLNRHIECVHLDLRPHICSTCQRGFRSRRDLTRHISSVHLGLKPYSCKECQAKFALVTALEDHVQRVHLNLRPHECSQCSASFTSIAELKRHIDSAHLNLLPHKCLKCEKRFKVRPSLKRHFTSVHLNIKPIGKSS